MAGRQCFISLLWILWLTVPSRAEDEPTVTVVPGHNLVPVIATDLRFHRDSLSVSIDDAFQPVGAVSVEIVRLRGPGASVETKLVVDIPSDPFITSFELPLRVVSSRGSSWPVTLHVEIVDGAPRSSELLGVYPNPFNPETEIRYFIGGQDPIEARLSIYNMVGQRVRTLLEQSGTPGVHSVVWDGTDDHGGRLGAGVYECQLVAGPHVTTRPMLLLK